MHLRKIILKLSGHLAPIVIFSLVGVPLGFMYGLTPFEIIAGLTLVAFSWVTAWEGNLLASEKEKLRVYYWLE